MASIELGWRVGPNPDLVRFFFTQRNFGRGGGTFSGACAAALQPGRAMSDGEDYGFEYSDDDQEEEDVNIENQYYNSKGLLADSDLKGALDGFKEVVSMEEDKGEWGFKAHKQMVRTAQPTRPLPRAAPLGARRKPAASPQQPPPAPRQVKLQFKQKNYKEMMVTYKDMLTYIK